MQVPWGQQYTRGGGNGDEAQGKTPAFTGEGVGGKGGILGINVGRRPRRGWQAQEANRERRRGGSIQKFREKGASGKEACQEFKKGARFKLPCKHPTCLIRWLNLVSPLLHLMACPVACVHHLLLT